MSRPVDDLAARLRRGKPDRWDTATVLEVIDPDHARVDMGDSQRIALVAAGVAVVAGQHVEVTVSGRIVTVRGPVPGGLGGVTMAGMAASIAALEEQVAYLTGLVVPGPGPNLVVNWLPTIDQAIGGDDEAQWNASGWWSDVTAGNAYFWSTLTGGTWYGSGPVAPYNSVNVDPSSQRTTKVAPCAPGSGYPVTAGTTYAASVYLLQSLGAEAGVVCRVGIEWQDAAGAVLSTSWGSGTDVAVDAYPWMDGATAAVGTWAGHAEAKPDVTATAPAGAVQARPIAETDFTDPDWYGYWYRVSAFSLAQA